MMAAVTVRGVIGTRSISPSSPRYPSHRYTGTESEDDNDDAPALGMGQLVPPLGNGSRGDGIRESSPPASAVSSLPRANDTPEWQAKTFAHIQRVGSGQLSQTTKHFKAVAATTDDKAATKIDRYIATLASLELEGEALVGEAHQLESAVADAQSREDARGKHFASTATAILDELRQVESLAEVANDEDFNAGPEWEASQDQHDLTSLMSKIVATTRQLQRRAYELEEESKVKSRALPLDVEREVSRLERQRVKLVAEYMNGVRRERQSQSPSPRGDSASRLYSVKVGDAPARPAHRRDVRTPELPEEAPHEADTPTSDEDNARTSISPQPTTSLPTAAKGRTASSKRREPQRHSSDLNISAMPGTISRRKYIDPIVEISTKPVWQMNSEEEDEGGKSDRGYASTYQSSYVNKPQNRRPRNAQLLNSPATSTYRQSYLAHDVQEVDTEADINKYPSYYRGRSVPTKVGSGR